MTSAKKDSESVEIAMIDEEANTWVGDECGILLTEDDIEEISVRQQEATRARDTILAVLDQLDEDSTPHLESFLGAVRDGVADAAAWHGIRL